MIFHHFDASPPRNTCLQDLAWLTRSLMVVDVNIAKGLCGSRWRRISTSHQQNNGEGNRLRPNNYSSAASENQDDQEGETFTAGVRAIWQRPTCAGSLAKDLPRLARRITVRTRTGRCVPLLFFAFLVQNSTGVECVRFACKCDRIRFSTCGTFLKVVVCLPDDNGTNRSR